MVYCTGFSWPTLVFEVNDDCIMIVSWWIHYCYYPVWVDEMLISYIWDCILTRWCRTVTVLFHVTESYWESIIRTVTIMYSSIVYRIHSYCYYLLSWLLFIVYMITVIVTVLLLLLSPHRSSILVTWYWLFFNWTK